MKFLRIKGFCASNHFHTLQVQYINPLKVYLNQVQQRYFEFIQNLKLIIWDNLGLLFTRVYSGDICMVYFVCLKTNKWHTSPI